VNSSSGGGEVKTLLIANAVNEEDSEEEVEGRFMYRLKEAQEGGRRRELVQGVSRKQSGSRMYVCVCMYVWMDGWMDGCIHACMYVCMYVCMQWLL